MQVNFAIKQVLLSTYSLVQSYFYLIIELVRKLNTEASRLISRLKTGVGCNVESANLEILKVEAPNVE